MLIYGLLYLAGVNCLSLAAFGWDKWCAGNGGWRIPELRLLGLAAMGGSPAMLFGQQLFRHKTRKQPFKWRLQAIAAVQLLALIGGAAIWHMQSRW